MNCIASVSLTELRQRRQKLQRRRQIRSLQAMWRSLVVSGMAGGLCWAIALPYWAIEQPQQVDIEGNEFLDQTTIRLLLPLSYPESLLKLEPQLLSQQLESTPPIAKARVVRQLLPPSVTIQVEERRPVAIALPATKSVPQPGISKAEAEPGFLDAQGVWMPMSSYTSFDPDTKLPTLKVIGEAEQYRHYWSEIYQIISRSPVEIFEIDWQNPSNLVLKTELGKVYLGSYSTNFGAQMKVLGKMRSLSDRVHPSQIDYLDLTNHESPSIQLKTELSAPKKPSTDA
ncbi:MAG: FtsQ-type POTRA domain-containing protein [Oscillatoria sp. PMC 1068.18]|nr:FtsQ-type POTRA domain-containing protein [Oscillatoria sp. PMC 1076.18]MEC4990180.1 FtsQ-type POTRA domain-containing protein [Oscillatoria sp. PMC 1068.18]